MSSGGHTVWLRYSNRAADSVYPYFPEQTEKRRMDQWHGHAIITVVAYVLFVRDKGAGIGALLYRKAHLQQSSSTLTFAPEESILFSAALWSKFVYIHGGHAETPTQRDAPSDRAVI